MDEIKSQVNLTSRFHEFSYGTPRTRPRSAGFSFKCQSKNSLEYSRSKSVEFLDISPDQNSVFRFSTNCSKNKMHGDSALSLSLLTDSSSKLLLRLLKEPDENLSRDNQLFLENNTRNFVNFKTETSTSDSILPHCQNNESNQLFKKTYAAGLKTENSDILIMNSEISRDLKDSPNGFSGKEAKKTSSDLNRTNECFQEKKNFNDPSECDKESFFVTKHNEKPCQKSLNINGEKMHALKKLGSTNQEILAIDVSKNEKEQDILKLKNSNESFQNKRDSFQDIDEIIATYSSDAKSLKTENCSKSDLKSPTSNTHRQVVSTGRTLTSKSKNIKKCNQSDRSFETLSQPVLVNDPELEKNSKLVFFQGSDSTYDEIIELLQTLEEDNIKSDSEERRIGPKTNNSLVLETSKSPADNLSDVFVYLEEIEKDENVYENAKKEFTIPSVEKLLKKTSVELAHEVLSLEIQLEDQRKGIKLLKDTIENMKEASKTVELEHQEILLKTTSDAEVLVKRHQKFIKQLLNEKKNLSETVSKLVQDLKSSEEKYKTNIKAMEEKHVIEVKKAKDAQVVADKIKREKWMEMKTQKIKEMTVKGLEPELSRMAAQQQQELTELRNLHRAEIEAMELKAARRTSELMDQLRTELTKEKENAITDKLNYLRNSMEREFEEERSKLHQISLGLKQRIRKLEEKLSNQEAEFNLNLMETKQEMEREKQKLVRLHQENLDELKRRHEGELNNLKVTLETDKQICLKNQEKQLATKFLDKEAELREQCKRERDREIEMVIEKFEKEQAKIQDELGIAGENKLKKVREKLEADIKELEANAADLKLKLKLARSEVLEKEELVIQLNSEIRQLETEINFLQKSCEKMTLEKTQLKEIIRTEFESNINDLVIKNEYLQKEILDLKESHLKELAKKDQLNLQTKNEMQKELTSVYSRIKAAINKKNKIIEALREENKAANERYQQLELILDKQRRNLLL